jgi:hypothetical protein
MVKTFEVSCLNLFKHIHASFARFTGTFLTICVASAKALPTEPVTTCPDFGVEVIDDATLLRAFSTDHKGSGATT